VKKPTKPTKPINTVAILGDIHCGSAYALVPPDWWNGRTLKAVKQLWDCWVWAVDQLPAVDLLILNGDLVEGKARKSDATGLVATKMSEQTEMAVETLRPVVAKARKTIRMSGTPYHETFDGPLKALDQEFGIKAPRDDRRGMVRDIRLDGDAILNVAHHPEGGAAMYRATMMEREGLWATLAQEVKQLPKATHIVRSHVHFYSQLVAFGKVIVQCPCWKLQDPYSIKGRNWRWQPDHGIVLMTRDEVWGHRGYRTNCLQVDTPRVKATTYAEL